MIDVESQVFTKVQTALLTAYPGMMVTSETTFEPSSYPCVCIEKMDTYVVVQTQDSSCNENHAEEAYTVNVYSNKMSGAKSEAKAIMAIVNDTLTAMNFTRLGCIPMRMDEAQKYRLTARYRAVVGADENIYRT